MALSPRPTEEEFEYTKNIQSRIVKTVKSLKTQIKCLDFIKNILSVPLILTNVATLMLNSLSSENENVHIVTLVVLGINSTSSGFLKFYNLDAKVESKKLLLKEYQEFNENLMLFMVVGSSDVTFDEIVKKNFELIKKNGDDFWSKVPPAMLCNTDRQKGQDDISVEV